MRRPGVSCRAARPLRGVNPTSAQDDAYDLVLSSGFLAFAHHSGFLQAVEEGGIRVAGVMGTSAGALAGSLYCAGYSPKQAAMELSRVPPIQLLRTSRNPMKGGLLSLDGVIERLRDLLPPTFEDLKYDFAVGVVTAEGKHMLVDRGPLPEAVAASAAIPFIFQNVHIPGTKGGPYKDGGVVDRIGLKAWRNRRRAQLAVRGGKDSQLPPCLVHVISRSSPFSGADDVLATGEPNVTVVHSPKSGVSFFSLGDFEGHMQQAVNRARPLVVQASQSRVRRASPGKKQIAASV